MVQFWITLSIIITIKLCSSISTVARAAITNLPNLKCLHLAMSYETARLPCDILLDVIISSYVPYLITGTVANVAETFYYNLRWIYLQHLLPAALYGRVSRTQLDV